MLKLVKLSDDQVEYSFLSGPKYGIGRKDQPSPPYEEPHWISLGNDSSISRIHAEIFVDHPKGNVRHTNLLPSLVVVDLGSKFNTFVKQTETDERESQLTAREAFRLSPGNVIKFGRIEHKYRVVYQPMIVVPSGLKKSNQERVEEAVRELGGHVISDWSEKCTHLVMDTVTLTVKAVCALLASKPIVTFNYFDTLVSYTRAKQARSLLMKDFIPTWGEKTVPADSIDLTQSGKAGSLFRGLTFLCWSEDQMTKLFPAISSGGGELKLLADCNLKNAAPANVLLLQPPAGYKVDAHAKSFREAYQRAKKRVINQNEISLAAVYRDITKHCNPLHDFKPKVFPTMASQTQQQASAPVIVPESQPPESLASFESRNVIEESFAESQAENSTLPGTSTEAASAIRRGVKHSAQENIEAPSPKRRSTAQPGLGPNSVNTTCSQSRFASSRIGRSTQSNNKTLSKIFGVSDSDEDEESPEDNTPIAVAATRSRAMKAAANPTSRRTSPRKRSAPATVDGNETEPAIIRGTPSPPPIDQGIFKRSGTTSRIRTSARSRPELMDTDGVDQATELDDNDVVLVPPKKQSDMNELATIPIGLTFSRLQTLPIATSPTVPLKRGHPSDNELDTSTNKKIKQDPVLTSVTASVSKINIALIKEENDEKPDINLPTARVLEVALVKFDGKPNRSVVAHDGTSPNYKGFRKNASAPPAHKLHVPITLARVKPKPVSQEEEEPSTSTRNSSQQENLLLLESSPEQQPSRSKRTLRSGSKSPKQGNKPAGKGPRQFNYQKETSSPRNTSVAEGIADPSEGLFDF